jgi:protein TonB
MRPLLQGRRSALLSTAVHAVVIAGFVLLSRLHGPVLAPTAMPGTAQGLEQIQAYLVLGAPPGAPSTHPSAHQQGPAPPKPAAEPQRKPKVLAAPATPSVVGDDSEGSLGDGNISIALVQFHPRPQPDLSTMTPGSSGDIVLDALIDDRGHIVHLSVDKSLGPSVDQQVIATVQQWTFSPATRNGTPIASEQQILFHYERSGASAS